MRTLHNPSSRADFHARLAALCSDAKRRWGKMTVEQMLWHVNTALAMALGQTTVPPEKPPPPPRIMLFLVLNLPWPKNAPTLTAFVARQPCDFRAEHAHCLQLLDAFASKNIDQPWPTNPIFGKMSGLEVSRLQAKHLDHHLKQFGV